MPHCVRGDSHGPPCVGWLICAIFGLAALPAAGADWEKTVIPHAPGAFSELRPVRATYAFGWNGITAATGDIRLAKLTGGRFQFHAKGGTIGLVRTLWEYDLEHMASFDAQTLRPLEVKETESARGKLQTTSLKFSPEGVVSDREEGEGSSLETKTRRFEFPDVQSLASALLLMRTQPWRDGAAAQRIVVYPATSAYLATITPAGHERITVPAGTYQALKLDVKLSKIGNEGQLEPHKRFRRATVWLSDDADRLILRIGVQIFVGKVFVELRSVQFDELDGAPAAAAAARDQRGMYMRSPGGAYAGRGRYARPRGRLRPGSRWPGSRPSTASVSMSSIPLGSSP